LECGGKPPLSRTHLARANEGSAKNPPKGKFVEGVLYVEAEAATHKATPGPALRKTTQWRAIGPGSFLSARAAR